MCFKIKCKLNKVITELGREGKASLLQTAETSISFSLTKLNVICKCALPMSSCGNVFRKSQKWMENNFMELQGKKELNLLFKLTSLEHGFLNVLHGPLHQNRLSIAWRSRRSFTYCLSKATSDFPYINKKTHKQPFCFLPTTALCTPQKPCFLATIFSTFAPGCWYQNTFPLMYLILASLTPW